MLACLVMNRRFVTWMLIFCDETTATVKVPESALTESQSVVVEELLCKYAEVFEEKPAGSARVEPMVVKMKEGWSPPPMKPYRYYPPRVDEAIKKDMDKQLRTGVVEESDADKCIWCRSKIARVATGSV